MVFKRIGFLMSGTIASQIFMITTLPILSRCYSPEQFGDLAIVIAVSLLLSIAMSLKFDVALVSPKSKVFADRILKLAVMISSILFLLLVLLYLLLDYTDEKLLYSLFSSYFMALNCLYIGKLLRNDELKKISLARFFQAFTTVAFQVILSYFFDFDDGLLLGYVLGILASLIIISDFKVFNVRLTKVHSLYIFKKFREFPLFNATQAIINSLASNALTFIIKFVYGGALLGQYSMATRIVQTPMSIVSQSVKQVLYKDYIAERNEGRGIFLKLTKNTFVMGLIPILPFYCFYSYANYFVSLVLGDEWLNVGNISSILLIWFYFIFVSVPATAAIQVCKLQKSFLVYEMILITTRVLFMLFAYFMDLEFFNFVIGFSIIGAIFNLFLVVFVFLRVKQVGY